MQYLTMTGKGRFNYIIMKLIYKHILELHANITNKVI